MPSTSCAPPRRRTPGAWLASATFVMLLAAGCSGKGDLEAQAKKPFDALRKSVRKESSDPSRADSIMARIDTLEWRSLDLVRAARAENDTLIRMYADRSVDADGLLRRFESDEQHRAELRRSLLEARARLESLATPEEWATLSKAETKTVGQLVALTRER